MQNLQKEVHENLVLIISIKNQLREQAWKTNDLLIRLHTLTSKAAQGSVQNGSQILRTMFIHCFLPAAEDFVSILN